MIRQLCVRLSKTFSNLKPQSKTIDKMADKIDAMNETMSRTSPKMFSMLMMATTLPTFYFGLNLITSEFSSPQFSVSVSAGLSYISIKNLVFFACISMLQKFKFSCPSAKHTLPRMGIVGTVVPPILSLLALSLPNSDNKWIVLPTLFADLSMSIVEAQTANYGIYPFWLFSYRHYIRLFDWLIICATFMALWSLQKRVKTHPH
jgi:hypothetical protein